MIRCSQQSYSELFAAGTEQSGKGGRKKSLCVKDHIQNMNLVIGCTAGCSYWYARNNVKRWHMIDDFAQPEFFPGKTEHPETVC